MLILGRWLGETIDLETEGHVRVRITAVDSDPDRGHVILRVEHFHLGDETCLSSIHPLSAGLSLVLYRGGRRLAEVHADQVGRFHRRHLRLLFDAPLDVRIFRPEYRAKLARVQRLEGPRPSAGPLSAFRASRTIRDAVA
jgi:sRNA-binding carbon storage regulator CsrA